MLWAIILFTKNTNTSEIERLIIVKTSLLVRSLILWNVSHVIYRYTTKQPTQLQSVELPKLNIEFLDCLF